MRYGLIAGQETTIGKTRAFDGSTLYLPIKVTDTTLTLTGAKQTDNTPVNIYITLVAVLEYSQCVQLFNVIFRRVLRSLEMKQVGRHYYDPSTPIPIPQHK